MTEMKNILKTALLAAASAAVWGCNDAEYDTLGTHAFLSESMSGRSTRVVITENGAEASVTACLSDKTSKDVHLRFTVDESVLEQYNREQAASFLVLPETEYEMEREVTIPAGQYSVSPTTIHIKPLDPKLAGENYAIPLRLVSADGKVPVTNKTATYVITTDAVVVSSYPMWTGRTELTASQWTAPSLPVFTVECRFQVSNTSNRNRDVFTNGNGVLLRFEDPQNDTSDHKAHSLVQFQGNGWYLNPTLSFEPNKWQHLALTYDGTAVTLYVNGAFAGTKEGTIDPVFKSAGWFGGADAGGGHGTADGQWWRNCKILCSELRIWSVCRTQAQIQNNMTSTSAKSPGLVAYWRMNEGSGSTFEDCTGNSGPLTTTVAPTWVHNIKSTDTETPWP